MNYVVKEAVDALNELHGSIPYKDYCTIMDGLQEIETLRDRDEELEELWEKFADVPMNPETECIEEPFMGWGAGIHREEIWHWFDQRHSKGVVYLLYHTESSETKTLMLWKNDFTHERNWNAVCEALGIKKEDTEVELRCVVCSHKERPGDRSECGCFECESHSCSYNHEGECRFALVHERKPGITDEDGCIDYDFCEGEG